MDEWAKKVEAKGHKLCRNEDGEVDHWVVDVGYHNGPGCELCKDSWCEHCTDADKVRECPGNVKRLEERERAELARLKEKYD